jgi:hypothetical protein
MGRSPRSPRENFNRGAWTTEEDRILRDYIQIHGEGGWNWVRDKAGDYHFIYIFIYCILLLKFQWMFAIYWYFADKDR